MYICTLRFSKTLIYMGKLSYKTVSANRKTVTKDWVLIDASDISLGRTASVVAGLLRGKHKSNFTPHVDCGDNVVVINADKIKLTGDKWSQKEYISHSGYPGGQKIKTAQQVFDKNPSDLIEKAVKGMLPKNKLGSAIFKNLRVYDDEDKNNEWLMIKQKNVVDSWGGFDIFDPKTNEHLGTIRRKFWKSLFRTKWELLDSQGQNIGVMQEDSLGYAIARRVFLAILPKKYTISTIGNNHPITMRQKFNPIIRKLVVNIPPSHTFDRRYIAGLAIVVAALDGRGQR